MAWNDYLIENGWNTPRYANTKIMKSDIDYADSFSNLVYDLTMDTTGGNLFQISNLRVLNDNRHPIYFVIFDSTGEAYQTSLNPIAPLYSGLYEYHGYYGGENHDDLNAPIDAYPLDTMGYLGSSPFDQPLGIANCNIETNMPVLAIDGDWFEAQQINLNVLRANYLNNGDLSIFDEYIEDDHIIIINEAQAPEPKSDYFTIYNTGQKDRWTKAGKTFVSGPYYRWCKIKLHSTDLVDGRLAFYRQGLEGDAIKLVPVSVADVVSCEYSTDGGATWNETSAFPYDYIYGERVNELGEFISATRTGIGGDTGVPLFATRALAEGWVNHDPSVDISDALNYEDIANRYGITNPTGAKEVATTMGDGGSQLRNYFTQEYVCSYGNVSEISNVFFDVGPQGIWESIADGLPMMGANPIDAICGLKVFNFDISQVLSGLSDWNHIYFGGYQYNLTGGSVKKVINHAGYKDLGTFTIHDAFSNKDDYRNYEPYCKLKIYIPTVGIQELSYNKYRGKTVTVRMYLDIKSGATLMCLLADNVLYDFFNGSCGVDVPITLTDKAALCQAQLQNLSNLAGVGVNMGTAAATKDIGAGLATIANFETTLNGMNNTSADQFNITKGGSSPMGNGYFLPTYVYLIFEYIKTAETGNLNQLEGRATNRSGALNSFSGYLQIDSINLQTTSAMSESEKSEFVSLLQSGVFI